MQPDSKKITLIPGRVVTLRLDLIDRNPKQPRDTFSDEDIRELADNIAACQILIYPILVEPHPEIAGRYMIVAGERRWRALKLLGVEEFQFHICDGKVPSYLISIIENSNRKGLNPIEEANSYRECMEKEKMSVAQLSAYTGKHYTEIYRALRLLKLAPEVQRLIREGKLNKGRLQDLAQYKKFSKQIEFAQQLVRGEDPPELVEADTQTSKWQSDRILALLPTTPEGLISRMLQFRGRAYPAGFVIDAFLKLDEADQVKGWTSFTRLTRENFVTQMCAFADKLNALNKRMVVLPETKHAPFGRQFQRTKPSVTAQAPSAPKPQDDKKKAVESKPPKAPVTMMTHRVPTSVIPGEPTSRRLPTQGFFKKPPTETPFPEPKKLLKLTTPDFVAGERIIEFLSEAIQKNSSVLLSKSVLGKAVGNGSSKGEAQKMVLAGFRAVREVWRSSINRGDSPEKQGFIELVSNCRHDMGNRQFHDLLQILKRHDRSADPINVDAL